MTSHSGACVFLSIQPGFTHMYLSNDISEDGFMFIT